MTEREIQIWLIAAKCMIPYLTDFDLSTFEDVMRDKPDEIHWPTPDDLTLSWPREYNLIVKERRRNFKIVPK